MATTLNLNIPLTVPQLAAILREQLPKKDRETLVDLLQEDEPTLEEIKEGIREAVREVNLAKQGKIKLKSAREFLNEL
ncbi:MAG: hypothetical protein LH606_12425 [Cytophagaceae bacterium]|nr:hypothetical protein [Cytophagaceae bacterium]